MAELIPLPRFRADLTYFESDSDDEVFDVFNHGLDHPRHPANRQMERNDDQQAR